MSIAFRSKTDGIDVESCCTFNLTLTKPAGVVDNDFLVAVINVKQSCCGAPTSIATPAGWTLESTENNYTTNTKSELYSKRASGEGASWTSSINPNGLVSTTTATWGVVAYTGVDLTTGIDATTTAQNNASSTNLTAPDITTVTDNAMVLNIATYNGTGTVTDDAATTQRVNAQDADGSIYFAEELKATAGAIGTRVPTIVGAKVSRCFSVALRPAPEDTGFGTGGTFASSGGAVSWATPSNAAADDTSYTTHTGSAIDTNNPFLNVTNFGFNIPSNATIVGVSVKINRKGTQPSGIGIKDNTLQILKAGTRTGTNKADTSTTWPTSDADANYGAYNDMWGNTLTPSDVNDTNFGISLRVIDAGLSATASVDYVTMKVHYTVPSLSLIPLIMNQFRQRLA